MISNNIESEEKIKSENYQVKISQLLMHFNSGQYNKARSLCVELISEFPVEGEAYHLLGIMHAQQGELSKAIELISTAIRFEPENISYKLNLANVLHEAKNYFDSLNLIDHALALSPDNVSALDIRGIVLKDIGDLDGAEEAFKRVIALTPDNTQVLFNLACIYQNNDKLKNAEDIYVDILSNRGMHLKSVVNLASIYQNEGRFQDTESLYLDVLTFFPEEIILNYNLGVFYNERKRFNDAIRYFKKALSINSNYFDAANNLAVCYWEIGNITDARNLLEKLIKQETNTAKALMNLCRLVQSTQEIDEWAKVVDNALREDRCELIEKQQLLVDQAIIAWLSNAVDVCDVKLLDSVKLLEDKSKLTLNTRAYHNYLSQLVKFRQSYEYIYQHKNSKNIYFVGDSHCLSANGFQVAKNNVNYSIKSYLVVGAKAWHLSQVDDNQFKASVVCAIDQIPTGAYAVFSFGEIDCRENEGIFTHFLKYRSNLKDSIFSLVEKYVGFIVNAVRKKKFNIIFYGVPAPVLSEKISALNENEKWRLVEVIELYNNALKRFSSQSGNSFFDVHSMTVDDSGFAKNGYHIDGRHLSPNIFKGDFFEIIADESIKSRMG